MTHGSLFSGIGGFDLAAEWMGWENVFHCEWNPFGQRVLKHYWPNAKSYHDITKTDFNVHRGTIDILTGGFPCQPYSTAGKRLGKADERHLFPEMLRAIKEIQPRWIIGENVRGLVSWNGGMVFDEVYADLESQGYEVLSFLIPAVAVNAPHRRDRVWFVAHSNNKGGSSGLGQVQKENGKVSEWNNNAELSNAGFQSDASDTMPFRLQHGEIGAEMGRGQKEVGGQGSEFADGIKTNGKIQHAPDTCCKGLERGQETDRWQEYNTKWRKDGSYFGTNSKNFNWKSRSNFQNFPTVSPICTGDDGLSDRLDNITFSKWRNESIKAAGNAIVSNVALQIFKTIQQFEHEQNNNRQE